MTDADKQQANRSAESGASKPGKALTAKQQRFVEEYIVDLNATQAAIRAGYSEKGAAQQGERLLRNVEIASAVAEGQRQRSERTEVTAERVLQELGRIGFADLRTAFAADGSLKPVEEWSDDLAAAVSAVEVITKPAGVDDNGRALVQHVHKLKLWDKNSALEKIGKHLAMFVERHEHTGKGGEPLLWAFLRELPE